MTIEEAIDIVDRYLECNTGKDDECQCMVRCANCPYTYRYKDFLFALRLISYTTKHGKMPGGEFYG